jgi:hypothetical protein
MQGYLVVVGSDRWRLAPRSWYQIRKDIADEKWQKRQERVAVPSTTQTSIKVEEREVEVLENESGWTLTISSRSLSRLRLTLGALAFFGLGVLLATYLL